MVPFYVGELNQISTTFSFAAELDNVEMEDESVDKSNEFACPNLA